MKHLQYLTIPAVAATAVAATMASASAQEAPGHIVLAATREAAYTTGKLGSPVTVNRFSPSLRNEDFNMDNAANAFGSGSFFWAPNGKQTNDYIAVTVKGATLVNGAQKATIFDPVNVKVGNTTYTVLAIPIPGKGPSTNVLTVAGSKLVISAEKHGKPSSAQEFSIR